MKTHPFAAEDRLVQFEDLVEPAPLIPKRGRLPNDVLDVAAVIIEARQANAPVIVGMGAHLIKLGLSPYICDLLQRDIITYIAMNGAASIHDLELITFGATSEDVDERLPKGLFGLSDEPASTYNIGVKASANNEGYGLGRGLAVTIDCCAPKDRLKYSILRTSEELQRPATVHVALGTDIVHMHDSADGAAFGIVAMRDFRLFCERIDDMAPGGVYINLGSAVIMPEVFLKAASLAIHNGRDFSSTARVVMDRIVHYRPRRNVLERLPGEWYIIHGFFEQTIPWLWTAITERLDDDSC